ncbi:MAG TPA: mannosyl-glycoprotein endo-beta-N-acetylglucosamidase, partial [Candidatus Binatia bacterium]|nr:mannosyl-glycoprotein endo-beta-N-acetylglucosamidase [Candidatus Binatia bacterium]
TIDAKWVEYPDWSACFADRKATLERLANAYPHYAAALRAPDPETYITEVSRSWSTDPARGAKCLSVFQAFEAAQGQP